MKGLIVEGPSDRAFVLELAKRLRANVKVRMAGRGWRKIAAYVRELLTSGCDSVMVLLDSHCSDPEAWSRFVSGKLRERGLGPYMDDGRLKLCVVVHALEAWLLADERALADLLKKEVKVPVSPGEPCRPDEELDRVFCRATGSRKRYNKGLRDIRELARRLSLKEVSRKCPSFADLVAFLKDI